LEERGHRCGISVEGDEPLADGIVEAELVPEQCGEGACVGLEDGIRGAGGRAVHGERASSQVDGEVVLREADLVAAGRRRGAVCVVTRAHVQHQRVGAQRGRSVEER
jgi:hypothetical protein